MKLSLLTGAAVTAVSIASPLQPSSNQWVQVPLEAPLNWVAGSRLFPENVISGYNSAYDKYNAKSWADHVLNICKDFPAATSAIAFSAINSGTPKDRYWFGYCYRGGYTTPSDYVRSNGVQDSIAYTVDCH